MPKQIQLTKGKFALVDDEDYEWLNQWKWFSHDGAGGYAARNSKYVRGEKRKTILMHRQIMGEPKELQVDHINRDRRDNRRENLRLVTAQQNKLNSCIQKSNTSGYRGVAFWKRKAKWRTMISHDNDRLFMGYYKTAEEAALAYDFAAIFLHGEFAELNFPEIK